MQLSELHAGEVAVILSLGSSALSVKLMEMGCLPGEKIEVRYKAPLGGPIAINVFGYILGLRKEEASLVQVEKCL